MKYACEQCGQEFQRDNPGLTGPGKTPIGRRPKYCSSACRQAAYRTRGVDRVDTLSELTCTACAQTKPAEEFYRNPNGGPGRRQPCGECCRARRRGHYAVSGEASAVSPPRRRRFGLSPARYGELSESQGGLCAICRKPSSRPDRALSVDHDDVTGRVRGLLCGHCDTVIGHARGDVAVLEAAIRYLRSHGVVPGE